MLRRILAAVMIVLGLALIGLGVASATLWRSDDYVTATMPPASTPVVLVMPGVLGLVNENVTVTATAPDPDLPVILAFARSGDVLAWVGDDTARTDITGLTDWQNLAVEVHDGAETTVPDPRTAELWVTVFEGTGEKAVDLVPSNGQVTMLAATDGTEVAPTISLTWPVEVETPYMLPLIVAGSVLMLIGLAWFAYQLLVTRELRQREIAHVEIEKQVERRSLETQVFRTDQPMTRRQLREMQRRFKEQDPRHGEGGPVQSTAGTVGAGILPGVADPGIFRALRHVFDDSTEIPTVQHEIQKEVPPAPPSPRDANETRGSSQGATVQADVPPVEDDATEPSSGEPLTGDTAAEIAPEKITERTSWRALWDIKEEQK